MVTGTPPCISCYSREEAPVCRREKASLNVGISWTDALCNMCFLHGYLTAKTNINLGPKSVVHRHRMQFSDITAIIVCVHWINLRAWGSSQTEKCIHSVVLPGIEEGLIVLRKRKKKFRISSPKSEQPVEWKCEKDFGSVPEGDNLNSTCHMEKPL